jgi:aromatic amino acid aminotransferase I
LPLFLREYVEKVYKPAYADWDVLLTCGATDAWGKIVNLLMEKGDAVLVEEWTYPAALNTFLPLETELVPIKMDGEGVIPEHLDEILGNWDEEKRGRRRPRVFYTIPTGQNPTGATMMGERKKQIYELCVKYGTYCERIGRHLLTTDVIICEDEPYYCLYTGEWTPKSHKSEKSTIAQRQLEAEKKEGKEGQEAFLKALPPTYLTVDYQGRVIRMDVSAMLAPLRACLADFRPSQRRLAPDHVSGGSPRRRCSLSVSRARPRRPRRRPAASRLP